MSSAVENRAEDAFAVPGTFMSLPARGVLPHEDVAIVGIPFDVGTHPHRIGCRQGPDHIRQQSRLMRRYLADKPGDALGELAIADWGNVQVTPGRPEQMPDVAARALGQIVGRGTTPLVLGGDGSVTLPVLRALHERHGPLAAIHFDAHTDAYPIAAPERLTTATTFTCAVEEGLVAPARSMHLGVRGTTMLPDTLLHSDALGFQTLTCEDMLRWGPEAVAQLIRDRAGDLPVYLCWDMDFYDPACAPGVAAPEWGGVTAQQGLSFLRHLEGIDFAGIDVGTVSPPHDVAGMTGNLAARTVLEILYLLAGGVDDARSGVEHLRGDRT